MKDTDTRRGWWPSTSGILKMQGRRDGSERHMLREPFGFPRIVLGGKQKDLHKVSSPYLMILEFCNETPVELNTDVGRILQYFTHSE